jgi:hypothetical protein
MILVGLGMISVAWFIGLVAIILSADEEVKKDD